MKLVIDISALDKTAAAVTSITDTTAVAELEMQTLGSVPVLDVTFTDSASAPPAAPSWAGLDGYTMVAALGSLDGDALLNYTSSTSFTAQANGWTGRLSFNTQLLIDAIKLQVGYAVDRARFGGGYSRTTGPLQARPQFAWFWLELGVIDPSGNYVCYARLRVPMLNRVVDPSALTSPEVPSTIYDWIYAHTILNASSITGLTGGGDTNLDGYDDSALPTGCKIMISYSNINQIWKLEASTATTDVTATPARVRSSTYATENRVWFQTG